MTAALIFRYELLSLSETFVASQAAALQAFQPVFTGVSRIPKGLPLPENSVVLMQKDGIAERVRRRIFLKTGWAPEFYRELEGRQPALIHAHFGPDGAVALPIQRELRVPLIVTLHGYDVTLSGRQFENGVVGRLYLKRKQRLWEAATRFICVSEFIRRKALRAGFPESKLLVHYIGINAALFAPYPSPRQPGLVLFVGRLVEKKGCQYLIQAMELVQRRCREAQLVIIGDGPQRSALQALAKQKALSCQFLGAQPSEVVRDWLASSQVFCVPSVTAANGDSEGLPMVIAEAMAMGVPVVSSMHAGIPEVVHHGETGLLAPERDHRMLADYILQYLTDKTFWRLSSERGVALVRKRFDVRLQTAELEKIYRQATTAGSENA